jgi:hypothetical protein
LILRTLSIATILLISLPAHAGWRGAEWGMTPAQVAEAMKGEAPLSRAGKAGKADSIDRPGNKGIFEWDGEKFEVVYVFDKDGLESIGLDSKKKVTAKSCEQMVQRLVTQHGRPLRISDQTILKLIIWHDKPSENRLRLMVSIPAGICTLFYERLSEYEAHDLANPGLEVRPPTPG